MSSQLVDLAGGPDQQLWPMSPSVHMLYLMEVLPNGKTTSITKQQTGPELLQDATRQTTVVFRRVVVNQLVEIMQMLPVCKPRRDSSSARLAGRLGQILACK